MIIDHVGYAVKKIDKAIIEFQSLGFVFEEIIDDGDRNVSVCFGDNGAYRIELVAPLDRGTPSPVDTYLSKVGPTAYHICYKSENMEADIENLEKQGFRVMIEPKFATAFSAGGGYRRVAFLRGRHSGILEIVDE